MKASVLLPILTSASASFCCIIPVLGLLSGSSSIISSVEWLEPFRPLFIAATFLMLGLAWYTAVKVSPKDKCGCTGEKRSFFQSKKFLGLVTVLSLLLVSFPSYSRFVVQNTKDVSVSPYQDKNKKITLAVNGMTCASCEHHIESEVLKLSGVAAVSASYESKSASIEYNPEKVTEAKIISTINSTGYTVGKILVQDKSKGNCCTKGACSPPTVKIPEEKSRNLKLLSNVDQLKEAFNSQSGKIRFVAILSSTCGWCLQGAQSIQKAVIEKIYDKDISVIIVWTNMVKTDDHDNAFKSASIFKDPNIVQFYDAENMFGDRVAKRLNPKGEKAWDIYMFYDKETDWDQTIPRPFDYAHQLSAFHHPWVDNNKYYCGSDLTKRLEDITNSL